MTEERNDYGIPRMSCQLETLTKAIYSCYRDLAWLHRQAATELPVGYQRLTHEARAAYLEAISADYKDG